MQGFIFYFFSHKHSHFAFVVVFLCVFCMGEKTMLFSKNKWNTGKSCWVNGRPQELWKKLTFCMFKGYTHTYIHAYALVYTYIHINKHTTKKSIKKCWKHCWKGRWMIVWLVEALMAYCCHIFAHTHTHTRKLIVWYLCVCNTYKQRTALHSWSLAWQQGTFQ